MCEIRHGNAPNDVHVRIKSNDGLVVARPVRPGRAEKGVASVVAGYVVR